MKVLMCKTTGELFIWGGGQTCWTEFFHDVYLEGVTMKATITCHYIPEYFEELGEL